MANWISLNKKYACAGELNCTSNVDQGSLTTEWFEVRYVDPQDGKAYHYNESRNIYANGEQSNWWEKWMKRGDDYFWCMGDYSESVTPVQKNLVTIAGKPAVGIARSNKIPEPMAYCVLTGSIVSVNKDWHDMTAKFFGQSELLESEETDEGSFVGFFGEKHSGTEILFDRKRDYMPTRSRSLFRKDYKSGLARENYAIVNFEARSKWEKLGARNSVPVAITNVVHHVNPKSKNSKTVDLRVAWSVDEIAKDVFSDSSVKELAGSSGKLWNLKSKLQDKLENIELPKSEK